MKNWFSRLARLRPPARTQISARSVSDLAESEARLLDQVESLVEQLAMANHTLAVAQERCDHARMAHAALNRRVNDLQVDWPAVHDSYFTKQGIAAREAGVPMNPKRKRK